MEIRNLITFLEVAERKSFTKTAEALGYTQSTVSSQIKQLETELNTQLFERINHKVMLTERGNALLTHAQKIVNLSKEIELNPDTSDDCEGYVRFAMAPSISTMMLGETFLTFHKRYPNIKVQIIAAETKEMLEMLDRNDADLTFIVDRYEYSKDHIVVSEKKVDMHFVANKDFPLAGKKNIDIKELSKHPFVLTEKGLSYRKLLDEKLAPLFIDIQPIIEMGNTDRVLEMIELGGGVSYLPDYVTRKSYEEGKIVYLDVEDLGVSVWRQLMYHKKKWISPAMKKVIDYCSEVSEKSL